MREYGSIYTCFWISSDMQSLSDQAKLLALYLLTGPHTNMLGCFRLPLGYVAEDLHWSFETVSKGLGELSQKGFITHDPASGWLLIHNFLKWNPIENPNQGKSIKKLFEQVPTHSRIFPELIRVLLQYNTYLDEEFRNRLETLSKPFRNQEQEQDQDQEQEQEVGGAQSPSDCLPETVASTVTPTVCQTGTETTLSKTALPLITLPLNDHTEFSISQQQVEEWQSLYPAVDILQALRHIRGWNIANPKRRKTRSGILRHIVSWLAKEQNHGRNLRENKVLSPPHSLHENNLAVTHRWLHRADDSVIEGDVVKPILPPGAAT